MIGRVILWLDGHKISRVIQTFLFCTVLYLTKCYDSLFKSPKSLKFEIRAHINFSKDARHTVTPRRRAPACRKVDTYT